MTELNSIEVKEGWKKYYFIGLLGWLIFVSVGFIIPEQRKETIDFFFGKWSFSKLPMFCLLTFWISFCLSYLLDKRIKIRIDKNGIWSLKNGNISWDDIWYFTSTFCKMKYEGDSYYKLLIRLKDTEIRLDKEVILKIQRMDKSFEEIRGVIEYYANKYKIQDLGNENEAL